MSMIMKNVWKVLGEKENVPGKAVSNLTWWFSIYRQRRDVVLYYCLVTNRLLPAFRCMTCVWLFLCLGKWWSVELLRLGLCSVNCPYCPCRGRKVSVKCLCSVNCPCWGRKVSIKHVLGLHRDGYVIKSPSLVYEIKASLFNALNFAWPMIVADVCLVSSHVFRPHVFGRRVVLFFWAFFSGPYMCMVLKLFRVVFVTAVRFRVHSYLLLLFISDPEEGFFFFSFFFLHPFCRFLNLVLYIIGWKT